MPKQQVAPYQEILTHGKVVVSSTALAVPDLTYAGANYNPTTATAVGLAAFIALHNRRAFIRIKNTDAAEVLYYGKDSSLTTTNGFSLGPGGVLDIELTAGQVLYCIRGGASDITVQFLELGY